MNQVRNKPRVFLSHCKRDIAFVQRLYDDLRHCQIDPWLDSEEIRHGQPWLDAIFESGIPTCDCVLVYLTPNSLESALVKKEIDTSLIAKLSDSHILFLPYVSDSTLRSKLRPDIQALQTPEWNDANYQILLPRVVAEIWRGFQERTVLAAISAEKVRRLEAELEVTRLRSQRGGVFAEGEDRDFCYIWDTLDRWEPFVFAQFQNEGGHKKTLLELRLLAHIRSIVPFLAEPGQFEYYRWSVSRVLGEQVQPALPIKASADDKISIELIRYPDLSEELLMFGLIERQERPQSRLPEIFRGVGPTALYTHVYAQKIERFKYWLAFNGIMPKEIEWSAEQPAPGDAGKPRA